MFFKILGFIIFSIGSIGFTCSQDITLLSISICEIIENVYSKLSRNVDIIDFSGSQSELAGEIVENLNNSMTVTLTHVVDFHHYRTNLKHQSILLFDNLRIFKWFSRKDFVKHLFINPLRFLVYCETATDSDIANIQTNTKIAPHYYFIILDQDENEFNLFTFENKDDLEVCHEQQNLIKINSFSSDNQKWITEPIFPKKYQNFYGCRMNLGVQLTNSFFAPVTNLANATAFGNSFGFDLVELIGRKLNFIPEVLFCEKYNCSKEQQIFYHYNVLLVPILNIYTYEKKSFKWNFVMINVPAE